MRPYERGTLGQAIPGAEPQARVGDGPRPRASAARPRRCSAEGVRPTEAEPSLALVLVPRDGGDASPGPGHPTRRAPPTAPAAASAPVRRTPGSSRSTSRCRPTRATTRRSRSTPPTTPCVYDVAFAMIWVDGDDPVTNTNEASPRPAATNCAAVAVAFQVVLIVGDADVVVPENLSTAVNYDCVSCLTYALASQLVVTLDGPLSDAAMQDMSALWAADRRIRDPHRRCARRRDPGAADRVRAGDPADRREGPGAAGPRPGGDVARRERRRADCAGRADSGPRPVRRCAGGDDGPGSAGGRPDARAAGGGGPDRGDRPGPRRPSPLERRGRGPLDERDRVSVDDPPPPSSCV